MVELDKYLPVNHEEAFRNGVNKNFAKIEQGFSQRDAVMNSHRTTQKNAHNTEQILHYLSDKQKEVYYRSELDLKQFLKLESARISNLVLGATTDQSVELKESRVDLEGKAHITLYGRLLADFTRLKNATDKLIELEESFDISKIEPQFWTELGGIRNVVQQYFWINKLNGRVYQTQSDSQSQEGFYINELTPSGNFLGTMHVPKGGHGTSLGIEYVNGEMYMWTNVDKKLVKFKFKGDTVLDPSTLQNHMPKSVKDVFFAPVSDWKGEKMAFRRSDGIIELRDIGDLNKCIDKVYATVTIPLEERDNNHRPMQGVAISDENCYWMSGWGTDENIGKVFVYDWNGKLLDTVNLDNLAHVTGVGGETYAADNHSEPEGLFFTEDKGKKVLFVGFSTGGTRKRHHKIYGFSQRGGFERYSSIVRNGAQNYALTRGDGKAHSTPDGLTKLSDLTKVGSYYAQGSDVALLTDLPVEFKGVPLWIDNLPAEQHNDVRQVITRRSTEKSMLKFERMINIGKAEQALSVGSWTVYQSQATRGEFINASLYQNKLSNITFPMKMYMTSEQANLFTDHPVKKADTGWFYENTGYGVTGEFRQTITINSSSRYEVYSRMVYVDRVGDWFVTIGSMIDSDDETRWQKRKVMFIGDSITHGTAASVKYTDIIAQQLKTTTQGEGVVSSAFSTGTVSKNIPAIVDRIKGLSFDGVTHVVFFAGTNDFGRGVELGTIKDTNKGTFYGAVKDCIEQLKDKNVKISFVTPILRFDGRKNDHGYTLKDFATALMEIASLNNLPVLDLYKGYGVNDSNKSTYIANDMLHPNNNGQRLLATKIGSFLNYKY